MPQYIDHNVIDEYDHISWEDPSLDWGDVMNTIFTDLSSHCGQLIQPYLDAQETYLDQIQALQSDIDQENTVLTSIKDEIASKIHTYQNSNSPFQTYNPPTSSSFTSPPFDLNALLAEAQKYTTYARISTNIDSTWNLQVHTTIGASRTQSADYTVAPPCQLTLNPIKNISIDGNQTLEEGVMSLVWELTNAANYENYTQLSKAAIEGKITEQQYVLAVFEIESVAFYNHALVAKEIQSTNSTSTIYTDSFPANLRHYFERTLLPSNHSQYIAPSVFLEQLTANRYQNATVNINGNTQLARNVYAGHYQQWRNKGQNGGCP